MKRREIEISWMVKEGIVGNKQAFYLDELSCWYVILILLYFVSIHVCFI